MKIDKIIGESLDYESTTYARKLAEHIKIVEDKVDAVIQALVDKAILET